MQLQEDMNQVCKKHCSFRNLLVILLHFLLFDCGASSGASDTTTGVTRIKDSLDAKQVTYITNLLQVGGKIYKRNCAMCHCDHGAHCDPPTNLQLKYIFKGLPLDSLLFYQAYVKKSVGKHSGLRKFSISEENTMHAYEHDFGKTLSDSLIKTVVEWIWLTEREPVKR